MVWWLKRTFFLQNLNSSINLRCTSFCNYAVPKLMYDKLWPLFNIFPLILFFKFWDVNQLFKTKICLYFPQYFSLNRVHSCCHTIFFKVKNNDKNLAHNEDIILVLFAFRHSRHICRCKMNSQPEQPIKRAVGKVYINL